MVAVQIMDSKTMNSKTKSLRPSPDCFVRRWRSHRKQRRRAGDGALLHFRVRQDHASRGWCCPGWRRDVGRTLREVLQDAYDANHGRVFKSFAPMGI